jgi:hypothetical protein
MPVSGAQGASFPWAGDRHVKGEPSFLPFLVVGADVSLRGAPFFLKFSNIPRATPGRGRQAATAHPTASFLSKGITTVHQQQSSASNPDPFEKHFTVKELASLWILDESTIRRMFQDVTGVFKVGHIGRRDGKRDYVTLRIPASVALRVYRQRAA